MIERLPDTDAAADELRHAGLQPSSWSAGPGTRFATHAHPSAKRLFVVRGTIRFNDAAPLRSGDGIRIDAGTAHHALVGDDGVECVEAFED